MSVVVLERGHGHLFSLPPRPLQLEQRGRRGLPPLGQEDDEGERLHALVEESLEVGDGGADQLLAEGGVGLERAVVRLEVKD